MDPLPHPFSTIPYYSLLYPDYTLQIQSLNRFTKELAGNNDKPSSMPTIYICREDTNSGLSFGGNKIRKLEYLVPDIISPSFDSNGNNMKSSITTLVTTGGIQSNHQRAVAAVAAHLGLKCVLVPQNMVAEKHQIDNKAYQESGNVQLTKLLGAEILPTWGSLGDADVEAVLKELRDKGEVPYWIPSGSSTHEKGGLGFARWAFELHAWEQKNQKEFNTIVVTCASGSTLGGMIAGFRYLEKKIAVEDSTNLRKSRRIIGIDAWAAEDENYGKNRVLETARRTGLMIGLKEEDITKKDVIIERRWNAGSYGRCNEETVEAMEILARTEGVLTDPVYTGKSVAGIIGMVKEGNFLQDDNLLFVHTGGQMVMSAYPGIF
ncbi:1-aminocyclopropane-1-carboxylate deaminase [Calycina marina]|uniref:1-aminocyclopropane-1-carboxylate deaminase n=1 Tax=Calycina marina TaxID=1763456 RepID=A0A9P7YUW7_9HELO|nr:1-aminocyclopropane-1-carboxylate deaminase [Calycina marina]